MIYLLTLYIVLFLNKMSVHLQNIFVFKIKRGLGMSDYLRYFSIGLTYENFDLRTTLESIKFVGKCSTILRCKLRPANVLFKSVRGVTLILSTF